MKLTIRAILIIGAMITNTTLYGITHLIGISNKTGSEGGQSFPTPNVAIPGTKITSIDYTTNNIGLQPIKINLPTAVTLTYDNLEGGTKTYTIKIEEVSGGTCTGNKKTIRARLEEGNKSDEQTCCVTTATNTNSALYTDSSTGRKYVDPYEWQNVVLALANNPEYGTNTKAIPFIFGIAPWTTTKEPWNKITIESPADAQEGSASQFTHTWTTTQEKGLKGLKVMQGNVAWIGGNVLMDLLPREGYDHITHIYNNTPYVLNIARNMRDSSGSNFNQLLPPWSATPWTVAWIPIVPKDKIKNQQISAIQLYALYAPQASNKKPLPGARPILKKTGSTEHSYNQDSSKLLNSLESGHSAYISKLLGETPIKDLMPNMNEDQYAVGDSYFRIFTAGDLNGETYIQKCNNESQKCTDYKKIAAPKTMTRLGNLFNYYKLIVSVDPASEEGDIQLDLSSAPYETVLEN